MANAYVTNIPGNAVFIIRVATNRVVGKLSVSSPGGLALSTTMKRLYVTSQSGNSVAVFHTKTRKRIRTIPVGKSPRGVAVTPDGRRIWVANADSNSVSVINALTNRVIRTLSTGVSPSRLAVSPDGRFVYVSNSGSNRVSVFGALSLRRIATVSVGATPGHIAFTPSGLRAYVVNAGADSISVIRTSTHTAVNVIPVGSPGSRDPYGVAVSANGLRFYVSEFLDSLLAIAIPANRIVRRLIFSDETTGAKAPQGIAIFRSRLYMVASANDQVEVRALPSLRVVATIDVPSTLESEQGLQEIVVG